MNRRTPRIRSLVAACGATAVLGAGVPLVMAVPATADTEKRGACGGTARYDYEIEKDDGRFEVTFEVDSNVVGQQWRIRLFQDGRRYVNDVRTTDREGEVDVERNRPDTSGNDHFRARAVNLRSGEACNVTIVRR